MVEVVDVLELPTDKLVLSKYQVRTRDVLKELDELVENIRVHGQLEPIVVAPAGDHGSYEIIAGQRRWLAAKKLGMPTVRAVVLCERVDEATASAISISENLIRRKVEENDLIDACTALYKKYGSAKAVAKEVGIPYNKVCNYVKFERLRPRLKKSVEVGDIDIISALKVEDYVVAQGLDDEQVGAMLSDIKGMTSAQSADYLRTISNRSNGHGVGNGNDAGENGYRGSSSSGHRPGMVQQIIVTLPMDVLAKLREHAGEHGVGQDKAAGRIIAEYFTR